MRVLMTCSQIQINILPAMQATTMLKYCSCVRPKWCIQWVQTKW